jgi:hypothetical protein
MVLSDNVDGGDDRDLIVTTMSMSGQGSAPRGCFFITDGQRDWRQLNLEKDQDPYLKLGSKSLILQRITGGSSKKSPKGMFFFYYRWTEGLEAIEFRKGSRSIPQV